MKNTTQKHDTTSKNVFSQLTLLFEPESAQQQLGDGAVVSTNRELVPGVNHGISTRFINSIK